MFAVARRETMCNRIRRADDDIRPCDRRSAVAVAATTAAAAPPPPPLPPTPPPPLVPRHLLLFRVSLSPHVLSTIPNPNQSRDPLSGRAYTAATEVWQRRGALASVSVLASYSGGLRPSLPRLCLPARARNPKASVARIKVAGRFSACETVSLLPEGRIGTHEGRRANDNKSFTVVDLEKIDDNDEDEDDDENEEAEAHETNIARTP